MIMKTLVELENRTLIRTGQQTADLDSPVNAGRATHGPRQWVPPGYRHLLLKRQHSKNMTLHHSKNKKRDHFESK